MAANKQKPKAVVSSLDLVNPWPDEDATQSRSFQFGNYSRYYGYRKEDSVEDDSRLEFFPAEAFKDKLVLDLGCNSGNLTMAMARRFEPKHIYGVDIDSSLIQDGKNHLRSAYFKPLEKEDGFGEFHDFLQHRIGSIRAVPSTVAFNCEENMFPANVSFHVGNCVPQPGTEDSFDANFDCVLALSLSKWIHMNFGDSGLKRLFKRVFNQLKPGGVFILEPQPWNSYSKKAKRNSHTLQVFKTLTFRPEQFEEFLLTEVGFKSCEQVGTPIAEAKGFKRPIFILRK